jgi:hypothetical protein
VTFNSPSGIKSLVSPTVPLSHQDNKIGEAVIDEDNLSWLAILPVWGAQLTAF